MAAPISTVKSNADIRFRDHAGPDASRNEVVMYLDFRVFIMGVEVTSYVKDSVSFTRALNGSENTCTFTLDNAYDRFVMTSENFRNYRVPNKNAAGNATSRSTFIPAYDLNQSANPEKLRRTGLEFDDLANFDGSKMNWIGVPGRTDVDESAKRDLFNYKIKHTLEFNQANAHQQAAAAGTNTAQMTSKLAKYKLNIGSCVINLHDEVRVFMADPNHDPVGSGFYRWMPVFAGVVSSAPIQRNRVDGSSTLSVSCSDIRYMLRKMRVAGNIQSTNQVQTYIRFDDAVGVFQDAAFLASTGDGNVKFENLAAQLSYRQLTRALLCGDNPSDIAATDAANAARYNSPTNNLAGSTNTASNNAVRGVNLHDGFNPWFDKINGATTPKHQYDKVVQIRGVGNFSLGFEISNILPMHGDWDQRVQAMETWQDLMVFGAKMDWYTDEEVTAIGAGTKPVDLNLYRGDVVAEMSPFSIMNSFVHYLFPGNASAEGQELGIRNLIERGLINPQADTSWGNRLDLLIQCTETIDYKIQVNGMGDICFEFPMYDFTPNFFGKYAECFAIGDSIKSDDVNDEGEGNVVTCLKVGGAYRDIEKSTSEGKSNPVVADQQYSVFIKSDYMACKYGIVVEEYSLPWSLDVWPMTSTDVSGKIVDMDAIRRNTLISFGIVEFYKRIAAMSSMSIDMAFNPFLFPNRPLLNKLARRIGLTDNVQVSLAIDGAPSVQADARWIRRASMSDRDALNGQTYQTIAGFTNTPFGYYEDGLKMFSSDQLDGIRTQFGIEIIDPKTNKIDEASKSAMQNNGSFNGAQVAPAQYPSATGAGSYSISAIVKASYARYANLQQTDPELYANVNRVAEAAGADPRDMYRLMEHESGGETYIKPQGHYVYAKKPKKLGAQGIIQFMPDTLLGLKGKNGKPIDPSTFLQDYPTVADQTDLAMQYYVNVRKWNRLGPLDTPYKLIMATVNPASLRDNMFADFAQSSNEWTRKFADAIKSANRVSTPAEFCLAKGYNYYNPDGGQMQTGTDKKGQPKKTVFYSTGITAPAAGSEAKAAAKAKIPPGIAELKVSVANSAPASSTVTVAPPRTKAL